MLKSKIHRATVSDANVDYEGSITIDADLMEAASILPFEQVHVLDVTNGERLQTYVIEGARGSGVVAVNGAAAKLVSKGDIVIVVTYDQVAEPETRGWLPTIVYVDEKNEITSVAHDLVTSTQ